MQKLGKQTQANCDEEIMLNLKNIIKKPEQHLEKIIKEQKTIIKEIWTVSLFLGILIFSISIWQNRNEHRQNRIISNAISKHIATIRYEIRESREMTDSLIRIYSNIMKDNTKVVQRHIEHLNKHMDHDNH